MNGCDGIGVGGYDLEAFPGLHVPNPDGFVEGAGNDEIGLGIEVDAEDHAGMTLEGLHAIARGDVPDTEALVVRSRADIAGIGRPREVGDALAVAAELPLEGRGRSSDRPYAYGFVEGSAAQEAPIL